MRLILSLLLSLWWLVPSDSSGSSSGMPFQGRSGDGRGIIFAMGPKVTHFMGVWASIRIIRSELKSLLPIEIWMFEFEWPELSISTQMELKRLETKENVRIKFLAKPDSSAEFSMPGVRQAMAMMGTDSLLQTAKAIHVAGDFMHFSTKPRALLESSFDEVILLDCDSLLFVRPELIFETDAYKATGTLFLNDKPIDWWPPNYPPYEPSWIFNYINGINGDGDGNGGGRGGGYSERARMRDSVPISSYSHPHPLKETASHLEVCSGDPPRSGRKKRKRPRDADSSSSSSSRSRSSRSNRKLGSESGGTPHHSVPLVCTQHRQESSVVVFDKKRQARASAILWDITVNHSLTVYERIYGDKDSYWLACELAGSPYAFSHWSSAHWGVLNTTDNTCPDKVIEPTIAHYLPDITSTAKLMSVNQMKVRNMRGKEVRPADVDLAISNRVAYVDALLEFSSQNVNPDKCPPKIAPFRRMQRCYTRHLSCNSMPSGDRAIMAKHIELQKEARLIFKSQE